MCTVSLRFAGGGVELVMNRDERNTRAAEVPAAVHREDSGVLSVRPLDPDGGGTWVGANEFGFMAAILNDYVSNAPPPPDRLTRGCIIGELLALADASAWHRYMGALEYHRFPPFTLLTWDGDGVRVHRWKGTGAVAVTEEAPPVVLTSSSWKPLEVESWRLRRAAESEQHLSEAHCGLPAIHLIRDQGLEPWGTLMSRPDARTRSIPWLRVDAATREVRCRYFANPLDSLGCDELAFPLHATAKAARIE